MEMAEPNVSLKRPVFLFQKLPIPGEMLHQSSNGPAYFGKWIRAMAAYMQFCTTMALLCGAS